MHPVARKGKVVAGKNCEAASFRKKTLKVLAEKPFALLFGSKLRRYEASALSLDKETDKAYVLFDNSYAVAQMHDATTGRFDKAELHDWDGKESEESDFEFLGYNATDGKFVAGREAVEDLDRKGRFHAEMWETKLGEDGLETGMMCKSEFGFESGNKGFEGGIVIEDGMGGSYLLGVCEGNFCAGGKRGKEAGNGRIVVMRKVVKGEECVYETVEIIKMPREAYFQDYSDLDIRDGRIVITSQENSAIFVGTISVQDGKVELGKGGKVYDFPRGDNCEIKYCNIEGVAFVGERMLLTVSDAMKGSGRQDYRCLEKDQSIHLFEIPP